MIGHSLGRTDGEQSGQRGTDVSLLDFRCPDCSRMFRSWPACLAHVEAETHAGWPKGKGLVKR